MNKDEAVGKLESLARKIDANEAAVDGFILQAAMWLVDKPWTTRAVLACAVVGVMLLAMKAFGKL